MAIEYTEFYYLIGACVVYLAALLIYNAVGGKKKKSKTNLNKNFLKLMKKL